MPAGGGGAPGAGAVAGAVAGAEAGAEDGAGAAAGAVTRRAGRHRRQTGRLGTGAAARAGAGSGWIAGQPDQAREARRESGAGTAPATESARICGSERLNRLERVADLVGDQAADVGQQLRDRLRRYSGKSLQVPAQGLRNLEESVDPPTQVVGVAGVIVDDVGSPLSPLVAAVVVGMP